MVEISKKVGTKDEEKVDLTLSKEVKTAFPDWSMEEIYFYS